MPNHDAPKLEDQAPLPWPTVYELLRFRWQNTPVALRKHLSEPDANTPVDIDDEQMRDLIKFAGASIGNGDPRIPRQLEAYRVLTLVPETYGAALFGVAMPA